MKQKSDKSRREFLKGAVATGGAVAIVAAAGKTVMASAETESVTKSKKSKGYEETQHIRDYYSTARN